MAHDNATRRRLGPRFFTVHTDAVPMRERFDFWHSHFDAVTMAPVNRGDYRARAVNCSGDDGVLFTDLRCDGNKASFAEGENGHVQLTATLHGHFQVTHGDDRRDIVKPGPELSLFDCGRAAQANAFEGHHSHMLTLPRALVRRVMGGDPFGGREALRMLPQTPLARVLIAQMQAMARHGPAMDARETEAAMRALSGLATAYLACLAPPSPQAYLPDDAAFCAACAYIDRHKENPALTTERIAAALGCSRAHLYRLFERRGLRVAEHLRHVRLNHARTLLRVPHFDIGDVALRCGYADPSAFGKAFRRLFGMTPGDWRNALN